MSPLGPDHVSNCEKLESLITENWCRLKLTAKDIKDLYENPEYHIATSLSPGKTGLRGFAGMGPHGNSYLAKILEILTVARDQALVKNLCDYCRSFLSFTRREYTSRWSMTTPLCMFSFLGKETIENFRALLLRGGPDRLKEVLTKGSNFRLATFPDGAGKNRYIAIGP